MVERGPRPRWSDSKAVPYNSRFQTSSKDKNNQLVSARKKLMLQAGVIRENSRGRIRLHQAFVDEQDLHG